MVAPRVATGPSRPAGVIVQRAVTPLRSAEPVPQPAEVTAPPVIIAPPRRSDESPGSTPDVAQGRLSDEQSSTLQLPIPTIEDPDAAEDDCRPTTVVSRSRDTHMTPQLSDSVIGAEEPEPNAVENEQWDGDRPPFDDDVPFDNDLLPDDDGSMGTNSDDSTAHRLSESSRKRLHIGLNIIEETFKDIAEDANVTVETAIRLFNRRLNRRCTDGPNCWVNFRTKYLPANLKEECDRIGIPVPEGTSTSPNRTML